MNQHKPVLFLKRGGQYTPDFCPKTVLGGQYALDYPLWVTDSKDISQRF